MAATVAYVARVEALLTRRAFDSARLQAAADAAIVSTIASLSNEDPSRGPQVGAGQNIDFDSIPVTIAISLESSRIDLNSSDPQLLVAFLRAQGLPQLTATSMVSQLRAGREIRDVAELQQLGDWHGQKLECWLQSFTVLGRERSVITAGAAPEVLAAVHWLATQGPDGSDAITAATPQSSSSPHSLLGEVVRISTLATTPEASAGSEWIGRITGDAKRPALTLRWNHGLPQQHRCQ